MLPNARTTAFQFLKWHNDKDNSSLASKTSVISFLSCYSTHQMSLPRVEEFWFMQMRVSVRHSFLSIFGLSQASKITSHPNYLPSILPLTGDLANCLVECYFWICGDINVIYKLPLFFFWTVTKKIWLKKCFGLGTIGAVKERYLSS